MTSFCAPADAPFLQPSAQLCSTYRAKWLSSRPGALLLHSNLMCQWGQHTWRSIGLFCVLVPIASIVTVYDHALVQSLHHFFFPNFQILPSIAMVCGQCNESTQRYHQVLIFLKLFFKLYLCLMSNQRQMEMFMIFFFISWTWKGTFWLQNLKGGAWRHKHCISQRTVCVGELATAALWQAITA